MEMMRWNFDEVAEVGKSLRDEDEIAELASSHWPWRGLIPDLHLTPFSSLPPTTPIHQQIIN